MMKRPLWRDVIRGIIAGSCVRFWRLGNFIGVKSPRRCMIMIICMCFADPIKKKPRPIGSGSSPMRKLGNCMLIQVATVEMAEVMVKVVNLVHGGRGANDITVYLCSSSS
jgi:hypothetical protein